EKIAIDILPVRLPADSELQDSLGKSIRMHDSQRLPRLTRAGAFGLPSGYLEDGRCEGLGVVGPKLSESRRAICRQCRPPVVRRTLRQPHAEENPLHFLNRCGITESRKREKCVYAKARAVAARRLEERLVGAPKDVSRARIVQISQCLQDVIA